MNIGIKIQSKMHDFFTATNIEAGRLLVGKAELREIKKAAESIGMFRIFPADIKRSEVMGLPIYEMDEETYLEVAP